MNTSKTSQDFTFYKIFKIAETLDNLYSLIYKSEVKIAIVLFITNIIVTLLCNTVITYVYFLCILVLTIFFIVAFFDYVFLENALLIDKLVCNIYRAIIFNRYITVDKVKTLENIIKNYGTQKGLEELVDYYKEVKKPLG